MGAYQPGIMMVYYLFSRFLSGAGKQVLLQSILAAMPSYAMSCFKLPTSLCKQIQSIFTRFWWDDKPSKKKMCWVAWEKIARPKYAGGLGFRDIETFNDALLAKISWRILQEPSSLLARVLLGKYCHNTSFLEAPMSPAVASHGWRGILLGRELLKKGLGWLIGDGNDIDVWKDPWLSFSLPQAPMGPPNRLQQGLKVSSLLSPASNEWDLTAIRLHLPQYEAVIRKIITSSSPGRDSLVWLPDKSGQYSTKTGYALAISDSLPEAPAALNWNQNVWKLQTSPKLKSFLWKATNQALALGSNLASRGLGSGNHCKRCGRMENELHTFLLCPFAAKVWELAPGLLKPNESVHPSFHHFIQASCLMKNLPPTGISSTPLFPWILWSLWKARNLLLFEDKGFSEVDTVVKAITEAKSWFDAQPLRSGSPLRRSPPPLVPSLISGFPGHVCFVDAAWSAITDNGGMGWVIYDPDGKSHSSFSSSRPFVSSALVAEALALRSALSMAAQNQAIASLSVFSDSKVLITLINSKDSTTELKGILHDIALLQSSFASIFFKFIPRAANVAADSVAKSALLALNISSASGV